MVGSILRPGAAARCAALAIVLHCLPAAGADWGFDAGATVGYNDNMPNAIDVDDRKQDGYAGLNFAGILHEQLGDSTGASVAIVAESASYFRYQGMDNTGVGARAAVRHKFGLGADVPWTTFSARALHRDYHYDFRDGWQYDAALGVGKRFGDRLDFSALAQYDRYEADRLQQAVLPGVSSAAYDVFGWTFGARADWLATQADTVSLSMSRRHGTVTAVTPPDFEVLEYSSAVARDPVFPGNPIAYRVLVDADTWWAAWSHAFGPHLSASVAYVYRRSRGEEDLGLYTANLVNLSISYSR